MSEEDTKTPQEPQKPEPSEPGKKRGHAKIKVEVELDLDDSDVFDLNGEGIKTVTVVSN